MNELLVRELLQKKLSPEDLVREVQTLIADASLSWEEKRSLWHFLYNTGRANVVMQSIRASLENKIRIPFDLLIEITARANIQPAGPVVESLLKGLKKQRALDEIIAARGWDKHDSRISAMRNELVEKKIENGKQFKDNLFEKFHFLRNQRLTEQAGEVLKRMKELYPDDETLAALQKEFEEDWAKNVLSNHIATLQLESMERTRTAPSTADEAMLKIFLEEGEKTAFAHRPFAFDLAVALHFMEDHNRAIEILEYAEPGLSSEWLRAELLFAARRHIEALEQINSLEIKYIDDPENTFAVSYLRAQCLFELGQHASALEILQSIVRVRPNYRSAHALILEWSAGGKWE